MKVLSVWVVLALALLVAPLSAADGDKPDQDQTSEEKADKADKGTKQPLDIEEIGQKRLSPKELAVLLESGSDTDFLIARRELKRWGKKAGPVLSKLLPSKELRVKRCAIELLIDCGGDPAAEGSLLEIFKTDEGRSVGSNERLELRRLAALALGVMKSKKALPTLLAALDDPRWLKIRESARAALVLYGEEVAPVLIKRYREALAEKPSERHDGILLRSLLVLGDIGGAKARAVLLEALIKETGDNAVAVRRHAAIGLGALADKTTVPLLIERLEKEQDHYVQKYIALALQGVTEQKIPPDPIRWRNWWRRSKDKFLQEINQDEDTAPDFEPLPVPALPKRKKTPKKRES